MRHHASDLKKRAGLDGRNRCKEALVSQGKGCASLEPAILTHRQQQVQLRPAAANTGRAWWLAHGSGPYYSAGGQLCLRQSGIEVCSYSSQLMRGSVGRNFLKPRCNCTPSPNLPCAGGLVYILTSSRSYGMLCPSKAHCPPFAHASMKTCTQTTLWGSSAATKAKFSHVKTRS